MTTYSNNFIGPIRPTDTRATPSQTVTQNKQATVVSEVISDEKKSSRNKSSSKQKAIITSEVIAEEKKAGVQATQKNEVFKQNYSTNIISIKQALDKSSSNENITPNKKAVVTSRVIADERTKSGGLKNTVDTPKKFTGSYGQSWTESFKQAGSRAGSNVKTFFTGGSNYESVTDPFKYAGKSKAEKVAVTGFTFYQPLSGTVAPGSSGFKKVEVKPKTYLDLQNEIETKREFELLTFSTPIISNANTKAENKRNELQSKINSGQLDFNKATSELSKFNADLEKEANIKLSEGSSKIYDKYPDIPNLTTRTGYYVKPVSANIIASVPFFGGYYLEKKKPRLSDAGLDIREAIGDVTKGKEPRKSELYNEYKNYKDLASMNFALGTITGAGMVRGSVRGIDALRVEEFKNAKVYSVSKLESQGGNKYLKVISRQSTPTYQVRQKMNLPLIETNEGKFIIGGGAVRTEEKVLTFKNQLANRGRGWTKTTTESTLFSRGTYGPAISKEGLPIESISGFMGEGYIQPRKSEIVQEIFRGKTTYQKKEVYPKNFNTFKFGGVVTSKNKKYDIGIGGRISGVRVYEGRLTAKIPIQQYNIMIKDSTPKPLASTNFNPISKNQVDLGKKTTSTVLQNQRKQIGSTIGGVVLEKQISSTSLNPVSIRPPLSLVYKQEEVKQTQTKVKNMNTVSLSKSNLFMNASKVNNISSKQSNKVFFSGSASKSIQNNNSAFGSVNLTSQSFKGVNAKQSLTKQITTKPISPFFNPRVKSIAKGPGSLELGFIIPWNTRLRKSYTPSKRYNVQVKKFGQYKTVGSYGSSREAISKGVDITSKSKSLNIFRISGDQKPLSIKGYKGKITNQGLEYLEVKR